MDEMKRKLVIIKANQEMLKQCDKWVLIYIIQGQVVFENKKDLFLMQEHDIVVISPESEYEWKSKTKEDVLLLKSYMESYQLQLGIGSKDYIIRCNSSKYPEEDYRKIRYILKVILEQYVDPQKILVINSLYYTLWECLKTQFSMQYEQKNISDQTIQDVLTYIDEHYQEPLNLKMLSERAFMSESTFSRWFKKSTGKKFVDYVRSVRLEKARERLLSTGKSITKVAYECGFSNLSVFNKNFHEKFGESPSAFRRKEQVENCLAIEKEAQEYLRARINPGKNQITEGKSEIENICVNVREMSTKKNPHFVCINIGMLADLLERQVQEHVRFVVEQFQVKYVRISNIFDWKLKLRRDHQWEKLNFDKMDVVFDFLREIGGVPFLEFPEKRRKNVVDIGSGKNFVENMDQENVIGSLEEWEGLLNRFLEHMIERYTYSEVKKWMFEISEDLEKKENLNSYIPYEQIYLTGWKCIRSYLPKAQIGGCGINSTMNRVLLKEYLEFWKNRKERPDFLTFISYPYEVKMEGEGKFKLFDIYADKHFVKRDWEEYKEMLSEIGYPYTPIWITEWNTSLSERNIYNDSTAKACHILRQMTDMIGEVDAMCYGSISDWQSQFYDVATPFVGATGLITKDGLCKPAYFAFEFWKFITGEVISHGKDYIITTRGRNEYNILVFYPGTFRDEYKLQEENALMVQELPYIFMETEKREIRMILKNLENGKKKISRFCISESDGMLLGEWKKLGYMDSLNRFEIEYMQKQCIPRMEVTWKNIENGNLKLEFDLELNEGILICIT